jgi:ABC-type antimicrobial peptide transport system permease subunit
VTFLRLALRSLAYYWRTQLAVVCGVAGGVAVLAGSLLVGSSVRESLKSIATSRLGAVSVVVAAQQPFTETLGDRVAAGSASPVAPMLVFPGTALHESSARRAGRLNVYGVDARFFAFHGVEPVPMARTEVWVSADLAAELGAVKGDALVIRIARPTDIPLDSLHARRDDVGRSIRLTIGGVLARDRMGDFSLAPGQGPALAVFVPLARLQRDLSIEGRVNTLLVRGGADPGSLRTALTAAVSAVDLGLTVTALPDAGPVLVESKAGLIPDAMATAVASVATQAGLKTTEVLTWLASKLTVSDRSVPYSLITALGPDAAGDADLARLLASTGTPDPIVLNEWAARDLRAAVGDTVGVEYLRWADEGRLVTDRATFRVAGIVPMRGLALDRRLAPDYPGITTASDLSDWDPPFPIDLGLVRPQDEAYWDQYRTAPKAFISLAAGQALWRTRHGQLTSIRISPSPSGADLTSAIVRNIDPIAAGFTIVDVHRQSVTASAGATDFGAYFSYFSFFLMVSALLLSALFFRLGVEQRIQQIGVLRAAGFSLAAIRRLLLIEGGVVAVVGAIVGIALAVAWAALMMFALRTWWVDAVGTTLLTLHVDPGALAIGAVGATAASLAAIAWTVRAMSRTSPRVQLGGAGSEPIAARSATRPAVGQTAKKWTTPIILAAALAVAVLSMTHVIPAVGGFFGAGALVLVGGLTLFASRIGRTSATDDVTIRTIAGLGLRNASWRPGRSLTVAGLVAAAVFLLVSVDSFRKTVGTTGTHNDGTGGFALIAESALPIVHDLSTPDGRDAAGLTNTADATLFDKVDIFNLRLRPGDDASCLNLYQPKQPRVVGVPERLIREGRFRFARTMATDEAGRANPWTLLNGPSADGAVPAIVDATSLEYVLHAAVGDVITVDEASQRPLRLRIVASLDDSVMQGEILIAESEFRRVFPDIAGYRAFLAAVAPATRDQIDAVAARLEEGLEPFAFDAQDTARRLEAFHRVENTYLSTFQALGGLGLVLGCLGLVAVVLRNVLERRRELALLGAAGFTGRDLQRLIAVEHVALVGVGLLIGIAAAALAVAPVVMERRGGLPWHALAWALPVMAAGLLAAFGATRSLRRLPLVASLRSE